MAGESLCTDDSTQREMEHTLLPSVASSIVSLLTLSRTDATACNASIAYLTE